MCAPSPPAAPDYTGAAVAQGQANKDAAIAQAQLGNANVTNPYGTQTVSYQNDPTTGNPVPYINQSYSPSQQQIFDNSQNLQQKMGMLGLGAADIASNTLSKPLDFSGAPAAPGNSAALRQQVIDAAMGRVNTDYGRQREQANADMIAAGIRPGDAAYSARMDELNRGVNDARNQAIVNAGNQAQQAYTQEMGSRQQAITELLAQRQIPLNEISAFRTGSQIQPLTFSNATGATVAPAPIFGATQAQGNAQNDIYNAQATQAGGLQSGLFRLGAAAIMA